VLSGTILLKSDLLLGVMQKGLKKYVTDLYKDLYKGVHYYYYKGGRRLMSGGSAV
jgi:hypothetical protein